MNTSSRSSHPTSYAHADDRDEATAPKFEPPTSEPTVSETSSEKAVRRLSCKLALSSQRGSEQISPR